MSENKKITYPVLAKELDCYRNYSTDQLIAIRDELGAQMRSLGQHHQHVRNLIAESICPYKIGQKLEYGNHRVSGVFIVERITDSASTWKLQLRNCDTNAVPLFVNVSGNDPHWNVNLRTYLPKRG